MSEVVDRISVDLGFALQTALILELIVPQHEVSVFLLWWSANPASTVDPSKAPATALVTPILISRLCLRMSRLLIPPFRSIPGLLR